MTDLAVIDDSIRIIEARGVKISTELFQFFADDAKIGQLFRFVSKDGGVVTVERVHETHAQC